MILQSSRIPPAHGASHELHTLFARILPKSSPHLSPPLVVTILGPPLVLESAELGRPKVELSPTFVGTFVGKAQADPAPGSQGGGGPGGNGRFDPPLSIS